MAKFEITIPDNRLQRVINAICRQYGYRDTIDEKGTPNPESRAQFARRMLVEWLKRTVRNAEAQEAAETAAREARQRADEEVDVT